MRRSVTTFAGALAIACAFAQSWPVPAPEMKPGTRWWWMGSAVDSVNIEALIKEYARAGMGSVEITPIYGVKGNEANDINHL